MLSMHAGVYQFHTREVPERPGAGSFHADNANGSGVQMHSGAVMWEPVVIFAIDAASNGKEERGMALGVNQFKLWCARAGLPVKELVGVWHGKREPAFLMKAWDFAHYDVAAAWCSGQESVLYLTRTYGPAEPHAGFRLAFLQTPSGTELRALGEFRRVSEREAQTYDCSTYEPEDGMGGGGYWVAGKPGKLPKPGSWEALPDPRAPEPRS